MTYEISNALLSHPCLPKGDCYPVMLTLPPEAALFFMWPHRVCFSYREAGALVLPVFGEEVSVAKAGLRSLSVSSWVAVPVANPPLCTHREWGHPLLQPSVGSGAEAPLTGFVHLFYTRGHSLAF